MKAFLCAVSALFLCVSTFAGNPVTDFAAKASNSLMSFEYSYKVASRVPLAGSGKAQVQNSMFKVEGNGLEMVCDSKTKWTVDREAKELIIEEVEPGDADFSGNPAILLGSVGTSFVASSPQNAVFEGKQVSSYTLTPKKKMQITSLTLYFHGSVLVGGVVVAGSQKTDFKITSLKFSATRPKFEFVFNTRSLEKGWVITDLR